jgi:hypothetical protein
MAVTHKGAIMATDIVGGLFGITPQSYEEGVYNRSLERAKTYDAPAQLQASFAQLGRGIGGALGAVDPTLQKISAFQNLASQADLSTPEGYVNFGKQLLSSGDTQRGMAAIQMGQDMAKNVAETTQRYALSGKAIAEAQKIQLDYSDEQVAKSTARSALQAQNVDPSQIDAIINNKDARTSFLKDIQEKTQTVEANGRVFLISKQDGTKIADLGTAPERGTKLSVDQRQQDKFAERRGLTQADALAEASNLARGGSLALGSIASMKEQDASGQLFTGPLANSYVGATNLLASVGLLSKEQTGKLTSSQIYDKSAKDLVMQDLGGKLGAQISDADRKFVEDRIPQLTTSQKARTELLNKLEEIQRGKIEYYKKMNAHANKFKNLDDFDFSEKYSGKLTTSTQNPDDLVNKYLNKPNK